MITTSRFKPAWFLANSHLQTIWPYVFRPRRYPPYKMERLELPDGDFVDLLWTPSEGSQPIVILLHGLEGSYHSLKVFAWLCEFYTNTIQTAPNDFSRDLNCFF